MAMPINFGAAAEGQPPQSNQPSYEEVMRQLAVSQERIRSLEEQTKIQRDAYQTLAESRNQQTRLLQRQLEQEIRPRPPLTQQVQAQAAGPTDSWAELVQMATGNQPQQPAGAPNSNTSITPEIIQQVVRQEFQRMGQEADQMTAMERERLTELVTDLRAKHPDLATNKAFTGEIDRAYTALRQAGVGVDQAYQLAVQQAAHVHTNYKPRAAQERAAQQQQPQQPPQTASLNSLILPSGRPSQAMQRMQQQGEQEMIIDLRPPAERHAERRREIEEHNARLGQSFFS